MCQFPEQPGLGSRSLYRGKFCLCKAGIAARFPSEPARAFPSAIPARLSPPVALDRTLPWFMQYHHTKIDFFFLIFFFPLPPRRRLEAQLPPSCLCQAGHGGDNDTPQPPVPVSSAANAPGAGRTVRLPLPPCRQELRLGNFACPLGEPGWAPKAVPGRHRSRGQI